MLLLLSSSLFQENNQFYTYFVTKIFAGLQKIITSCLKFYSSRTRLYMYTIWHPHTFAIYLYKLHSILHCQLRSTLKNLLSFLHSKLIRTYSARSFSVAAPTLWNTLPPDIKNSSSGSILKKSLNFPFSKSTLIYNFLDIFMLVLLRFYLSFFINFYYFYCSCKVLLNFKDLPVLIIINSCIGCTRR